MDEFHRIEVMAVPANFIYNSSVYPERNAVRLLDGVTEQRKTMFTIMRPVARVKHR